MSDFPPNPEDPYTQKFPEAYPPVPEEASTYVYNQPLPSYTPTLQQGTDQYGQPVLYGVDQFGNQVQYGIDQYGQPVPYGYPFTLPTAEFNINDFFGSWWRTIWGIFTNPVQFFGGLAMDDNILPSYTFLLLNSVIFGAFYALTQFAQQSLLTGLSTVGSKQTATTAAPTLALNGIFLLSYVIIIPIFALIGNFIGGGIYWVCAKIFGGQGSYLNTCKGLAYVQGAFSLLSWIPCLNLFLWVIELIYQVIMVKQIHRVDYGRAAGAVLLPLVLVIGLCGLAFVGIIALIFGSTGGLH